MKWSDKEQLFVLLDKLRVNSVRYFGRQDCYVVTYQDWKDKSHTLKLSAESFTS